MEWNVLRFREASSQTQGMHNVMMAGGGLSPHTGVSLGQAWDKHCFPSTHMEGVQSKLDCMAELGYLSEKSVVMSWAWHKI